MAEYGLASTQLSAPQGAGTAPIAPVEERVTNLGLPPIIKEIGDIFANGLVQNAKAKAQEAENSVVQDYITKAAAITDAKTSGQMSSARASAELKALWSKTMVGNAKYAQALTQARSAFFGGSAAGDVQREEDNAIKLREQDKTNASNAGYIFYQGMSADAEEAAIKSYKTARRVEADWDNAQKRSAEARAAGTYARSVQEAADKEEARRGLLMVANDNFDSISASANDLVAKVRAGMPYEEAQALHKTNIFRVRSALNSIASANPELAAPWVKLFDDMDANTLERLDPNTKDKRRVESLELQFKEMVAKAKLSAMQSSPRLAKAIVATNLFPGEQMVSMANAPVVAEYLLDDTSAAKPVGTKEDKVLFDTVKTSLNNLYAGKVVDKEKATEEAAKVLNRTLKDVTLIRDNPEVLKEASKFYASPEFAKMVMDGKVDNETAQAAKYTFQTLYGPAVQEAILNKLGDIGNVDIRMNGGKISFGYKSAEKDTISQAQMYNSMDSVGSDYQATEKRHADGKNLNDAAVAANQLLRLFAHLEGTTDYAKYWEANKHEMFKGVYPNPVRLKVGEVKTAKNGKKYKYVGGPVDDIANSWMELSDAPAKGE